MGRTIPTGLQPLLDLKGCDAHTTLTLIPASGPQLHFATDDFVSDGKSYVSNLVRTDEIRQSVGLTTDRVNATVQNVDGAIGAKVLDESLVRAEAVIGRYYVHSSFPDQNKWVELFRGQAIPLSVEEAEAVLEILNDLTAAGYCVANWTLAENCQVVFKHPGTCGYVGALPTCNKRRKSLHGCEGRDNEHRFVGMEYPEPQIPGPPTTGGGGGSGEWEPVEPPCPRLDQWVRVRGRGYAPVPKQVGELKDTDELYHPIWKTFHEIDSLTVVRDQPIWVLETENKARGFSSFSHPVLWYREHANGSPVSGFLAGDPVLTWSNGELIDSKSSYSDDLDELGDVMKITMVDGRIYCYSDTPDGPYIVCHNSKPIIFI